MKHLVLLALSLVLACALGCPSPDPYQPSINVAAYADGYSLVVPDEEGQEQEFQLLLGPGCSLRVPAGGVVALHPSRDTGVLKLESELLGGVVEVPVFTAAGVLSLGFDDYYPGVGLDPRPGSLDPVTPVVLLPNGGVLRVDLAAKPLLQEEIWEGELADGKRYVIRTWSSVAHERIEFMVFVEGKPIALLPETRRTWSRGKTEHSFLERRRVVVSLEFDAEAGLAKGTRGEVPIVLRRLSSEGWNPGQGVAAVSSGR